MHAVLVLDFLEGARRRPADFRDAGVQPLEFLDPGVGDEVDLLGVASAEDVPDEVAVRRVAELGAAFHLGGGEALEVEPFGELDGVRGRLEALHHHHPLEVAAAGAPRHLREQLEGALARPEVG